MHVIVQSGLHLYAEAVRRVSMDTGVELDSFLFLVSEIIPYWKQEAEGSRETKIKYK